MYARNKNDIDNISRNVACLSGDVRPILLPSRVLNNATDSSQYVLGLYFARYHRPTT